MSIFSWRKDGPMKSIITTYPDFISLPREIKKLLLASESYFFDETKNSSLAPAPAKDKYFDKQELKSHAAPEAIAPVYEFEFPGRG